jgi:RNA polymerase-binding transcription factor DksA
MPTKKSKSKPKAKTVKPVKPAAKKASAVKAKAKTVVKPKAKAKPLAKTPAASKAKISKPSKIISKKTPAKKVAPKAAVAKSKTKPKAEVKPVPTKFKPVLIAPKKFGAKKPEATGAKFGKPVEKIPAKGAQDSILSLNAKKKAEFLNQQKHRLLDLRDHILDQMQGVAQDSLRSRAEGSEGSAFGMHQADAGSDAYEKDFALSLLSQEQDALYEIEESLKRIESGGYGICEMSNQPIPLVRLEAIPFARFTVDCQDQYEKENRGRRRWETSAQFMDAAEATSDEEEGENLDDEDRKKEKE